MPETSDYDKNRQIIAAYRKKFAGYNRFRKAWFHYYFRFYHRLIVTGLENIPDGPAIVMANHGGGFDLDIVALMDHCHPTRTIHALIAQNWHYISHWWGRYYVGGGIPLWTRGGIRWEYIDPYLARGGENFPGLVAMFPEGHSGTYKDRHVLHRFFPGIVRIALKYRVPIVPAAMIGFHCASPIFGEIERDHGPNDILCLPFTLPVKLKVEFGEAFELADYYDRKLTRDEQWAVANDIVRPRLAALLGKYMPLLAKG